MSIDMSGLDELIRDMNRLGENTGAIAEAMVDAAVVEIRDAWKETAEDYGYHASGEMIESIGFPDATVKTASMLYRDVYPQGKDSETGVRNAEKAFLQHYGYKKKDGSYWVDEAEARAAPRVAARLEKMWADFLDTGKVPTVNTGDSAVTTHKT